MYHYSSPPRGWPAYDYTTSPPASPQYNPNNPFYASPHANASPRGSAKRHARKTSYASPRESGWYSAYATNYDTVPEYASPRKHDNVSAFFEKKKRKHRASMPGDMPAYGFRFGYDYVRPSRTPKRPIIIDVVDDADDEPAYIYREPQSVRFERYASAVPRKPRPTTDHSSFFSQVPPIYEEDVKRSRARRASTSTRTSPPKPKMTTPPKAARKATEEDAEAAGIPTGYSIKNWDPTEAPILLLGSVFDANSLGKWIYDWTVYYHGASTPMADVAGELWLLLIKLAGKVKRADECLDRVRRSESRELLNDFLDSGDRLWTRFKVLLKDCEHFMWKAAKRESGRGVPVSMGRNAGCEFVASIFGRDRKLQDTEKLMNSIRLWDMRFDANCETILRPSRTSSRRQSTV
ncbi:hypothetical protein BGW36DRAFT_380935 [Talaromyces proteolyticus]|uniref:Vegetative cell wall protein gp1 n=1 Tax=Talaromyces proteolyticus TaxID=1131652 RepID=A0AAD4KN19_9EURO|nr:uncharacterized protein BGW36DRAFT_380935 [Talaromyces proteolyticus]KAH8696403.1 hypothetical protein BGW36DRAFT_380935 [Talaromyces proteolyticus]